MKKYIKIFLVYFPVILVGLQVLANALYLVNPAWYYASGFYLNTFIGSNVLFALFLVSFTFYFKFCEISRWAAIAECLFALNYLIVQQDNLYNILFQVIVGLVAVVLTFSNYIKKFPLCLVGLFVLFFKKLFKYGNCRKAIEDWDEEVKRLILSHHDFRNKL